MNIEAKQIIGPRIRVLAESPIIEHGQGVYHMATFALGQVYSV